MILRDLHGQRFPESENVFYFIQQEQWFNMNYFCLLLSVQRKIIFNEIQKILATSSVSQ